MADSSSGRSNRMMQRRKVLSEEEYTSTLSSIVARDYFPDIAHLERQDALLDRRSRGDVAGAVAVRRATRRLMEHDEIKAALREQDDLDLVESEESGTHKRALAGIRKRPRPLEEETLTGFHQRVTNEDDQEFDSNLKQEINLNRQRLDDLFEGPNALTGQDTSIVEMASDDFTPEANTVAANQWNRPNIRNGLFFNPTPLLHSKSKGNLYKDNEKSSLLLDGKKDAQSTSQEVSLMLSPSNQQTKSLILSRSHATKSTTSSQNAIVVSKNELVEYIPKHVVEKKIQPAQTRFPSQQIIPLPNRHDGIAPSVGSGTDEYQSSTNASHSTDLDAPLRPIEQERKLRSRQMKATHGSFVTMTPQILPGAGAGSQSPITTWGTVEGTPAVLSGKEIRLEYDAGSKGTGSSFRLATESARDRAAQKAEADMARRVKKATSSSSSSKQRTDKSTLSLTPTALSLLDKMKNNPSRGRDAFASALRISYTPRPPSLSKASKSQVGGRDHAYNELASRHHRKATKR